MFGIPRPGPEQCSRKPGRLANQSRRLGPVGSGATTPNAARSFGGWASLNDGLLRSRPRGFRNIKEEPSANLFLPKPCTSGNANPGLCCTSYRAGDRVSGSTGYSRQHQRFLFNKQYLDAVLVRHALPASIPKGGGYDYPNGARRSAVHLIWINHTPEPVGYRLHSTRGL